MNSGLHLRILSCLLWLGLTLAISDRSIAQIPSFVPTAGLVAWYNFNGNLLDETGGGSNGVAYGAVAYGTDRFGATNSCYQGNGASEIDIPVHNFPLGNSARSVSVFFQYNLPYAGGGRTFMGWGNNSFAGRFGLFAADTYVAMEYVNGHVKTPFTPDGLWHNLTVTYPASGGGSSAIKLYVDGCLAPPTVVLPTGSYSTAYGTWHGIGGHIYFLPSYPDSWTGKLDDIGVWNRELTPAEVAQIWAASPPAISGPTSVCAPGAITLTASVSGGTWSSGSPTVAAVSGGVVSGISSGTSIISYSFTNTCGTVIDTQVVTVNAAPNAGTITGPANICIGSSMTLTDGVSGGTWTTSNAAVATIGSTSGFVTGLTIGSAIISYTTTNSCGTATDTQMVTVISAPSPGIVSGPTNICVGSSITLISSGTGGSWGSSNPGVAGVGGTGVVNGFTAGTTIISYSVTNSCGTATDTQMIAVITLPNAGAISGPTNVCAGSAITLISSGTGGSWSSSNPGVAGVASGTGVVNGLTTGTTIISYSVTNSCGTATDTQMITVNPLPNAGTITGPSSICPGSSVTFNDPAPGGAWSSSNLSVVTIGATTGIAGGGAVGSAIISYSVTNSCGTATDTQAVAVTLVPSAGTIIGPTSVCVGTNISLSNGTSGGTWTSGSLAVATVNSGSGIVGGVASGIVIITYSLTNSCGTAIDTQSIVVNSLPTAGTISGATGLCAGTSISLTNATPGGAWSSSNNSVATVSGSVIVGGVAAGSAIISYSVTNVCGTAADTQAVIVNPLPDAGMISSLISSVCIGASITLNNTVAGGTWSSSNLPVATVNSSTGQIQALSAGTTVITYTAAANSFGCTSYTVFPLTVTINGGNLINATVGELKCNGDNNGMITLTVAGGSGTYQYIWSNGNTTASINNLAAGPYTVMVKDLVTNCADTEHFNLVMPSVMDIESTVKNDICNSGAGNANLVNVIGGTSPYSYLWSTGATASGITGLSVGDYTVVITDKNLCTKSFTLNVNEDSCNVINIHNVITPNGDGINDAWVIEGINRYPGSTVQLFDKWGDIVFDAKNYNNDWTGGTLPDGTYFYLIKLNGPNLSGGKDIMKGNLLIKR